MKFTLLGLAVLSLPVVIIQGSRGVIGPFTMNVQVPLWFLLFGWIAPTGDVLLLFRRKLGIDQNPPAE